MRFNNGLFIKTAIRKRIADNIDNGMKKEVRIKPKSQPKPSTQSPRKKYKTVNSAQREESFLSPNFY
jgi:hypothetical protein